MLAENMHLYIGTQCYWTLNKKFTAMML